MLTDMESGKLKRCYDNAHEEPIYRLIILNENNFATGIFDKFFTINF